MNEFYLLFVRWFVLANMHGHIRMCIVYKFSPNFVYMCNNNIYIQSPIWMIMLIRPATKEDIMQCVKILHEPYFQFPEGGYPNKQFVSNYLDKDFFLVAVEGKKVIGLIFGEKIKGKMIFLWYFAVQKNQRSKGIGKQLISAFEANCKKKKIGWIILMSVANDKTLNFYRKNKFNEGKMHVEFNKKIR
jgi:ribosomal protein S18 acetylase RimI-like enzyme